MYGLYLVHFLVSALSGVLLGLELGVGNELRVGLLLVVIVLSVIGSGLVGQLQGHCA